MSTLAPYRPSAATRRLFLGGGAVLTAGLVFFSGAQMLPLLSGKTTERQYTAYTTPVTDIDVHTGNGSVTVIGDRPSGVTVERTGRSAVRRPASVAQVVRGHLVLASACGMNVLWSDCEVDYVVHAPSTTTVTVESRSGQVTVRDLRRPVTAHAGSGSIVASGLAGPVDLRTASGSIDASDLSGSRTRLRTGSGEIDGAEVHSTEIDAQTGSGAIDLDVAEVPDRVVAETGSGSVRLGLPSARGGYDVHEQVGSGHVAVGVDRNSASRHQVTVSTGSGDVSVNPR